MTDELELLKKHWQKEEKDLPKLSYAEIHKMIWKKSSSIVKWILIISILEFALPHLLYLLPSMKENMKVYENLGVSNYFFALNIFYYSIAIYFIYKFYNRFREISVLDDSKKLMNKIIRTRKTVKHWVLFSLSTILVFTIITVIGIYLNNDVTHLFPELKEGLEDISPDKLRMTLVLSIGIFGVLLTLFMGAVYFLLYGLLLRKLNKNYAELKQLEI